MKRYLSLTLALIFLLMTAVLSSSCARDSGDTPVGMKNASGKANDFYLYVPDEWIINTSDTDLMASARVSENDPSNITMIGYEDAGNEYSSIDSYWEYYQNELSSRIFDKVKDEESGEEKTTFKMAETENGETQAPEKILIAGNEAQKYEYSGTVAGMELSYMQIIVKKANIFYIITYTSTPELYERHSSEIDTILKFVEFK